MMELFDIHTHHSSANPFREILNIRFLKEKVAFEPGRFYSLGVHPWEAELEERIDWTLFEELARNPQVLAVGECGLDRLVHAERMSAQERIFLRQLTIAERVNKPLLIHNVKSTGTIELFKKNSLSTVPWIQHGFRGKPQLAGELLRAGFYLSFGVNFHADALRAMPPGSFFFETDDSETDIREVYERAARTLDIPMEKLAEQVQRTIKKVFFKS